MSSLTSPKSNLYRERRKHLPRIPQSRVEVTLTGDWANMLGCEPFVLGESSAGDKIILPSPTFITECFYVDGTFKTCPHLFYQKFFIHIIKYNQTFPMVYALLPNKQQRTYQYNDRGLDLTPSSVLSDFEQAFMDALQLNFPTAEHRGCYYHYSQAIWQKVQALGLQEECSSEDGILKSFVQNTEATCFVPPKFVRVAWQGVQQEAPELDTIDDFDTYFDRAWINGKFRLQQWNYHNYNGL